MAETYFVRFRGRTVGPYSLAQAQQMARKGQLSRASEVSNDGQAWSQAGSFPEIFERPAGNALTPGKSSSLSIDTDLSPGGSVTFPAFEVPKTPSPNEWYYTSGDEQKGPTSSTNIVAMIKAGALATQDRVWREGLDNWVSVSDVPEFSAAIGPVFPQATATSRGAVTNGGAFCRECGARINRKAVICTQCGVPQNSEGGEFSFPTGGSAPRTLKQAQRNGLVVAGYVCLAIGIFIFGILFGLGACVIGIINVSTGHTKHGVIQIILGAILVLIGAAMMNGGF